MPDDIQAFENYERTSGAVEIEGVRVADARSRSPLLTATRQLEPGDKASTRKGNELVNADSGTFTELRSTHDSRRPGALRPSIGDRDNRPMIQVVGKGAAPGSSVVVGTFTDMILQNVQEQEAEKSTIIETFGAPHFFVAGRFVRKYVFAGHCRAAPLNHAASRVASRVPQAVLMRKFYEDYLRMSQQVPQRRFTRITVDGDVYDGYVTTLNLSRASDNEHMTQFTFSLIGLRRGHAELDAAAAALLRSKFGPITTPPEVFDETKAKYERQDSFGELHLFVGGDDNARLGSLALEAKVPKDKPDDFLQPAAKLYAVGDPQSLTVTTDRPGLVALVYATATASQSTVADSTGSKATQVSGTLTTITPAGTPGRGVLLQVIDYRGLYESLIASGGGTADSDVVTGAVTFSIYGTASDVVTIVYNVSLSGKLALRLAGGMVTYPNSGVSVGLLAMGSPAGGGPANFRSDSVVGYTDTGPGAIANVNNLVPFQLDLQVKDDAGNAVPDAALAAITFELTGTDLVPTVGANHTLVKDQLDNGKIQGRADISSIAPVAGKSMVRVMGMLPLQAATDLRIKAESPFRTADTLRVGLAYKLSATGYAGAVKGTIQLGIKFLNDPKEFFDAPTLSSENLARTLGLGHRSGVMVVALNLKAGAKIDEGHITAARGSGTLRVQFPMMLTPANLPLNGGQVTINWTSTEATSVGTAGGVSKVLRSRSAKLSVSGFYSNPAVPTLIVNIEMTADGPQEYHRFTQGGTMQLVFSVQTGLKAPPASPFLKG